MADSSTVKKTRWISDRAIGIAGVIIGILSIVIGIAISYYFYQRSIEYRQLTFAIDPVRTAIVNSGESSDLTVLYKGHPVRNANLSSIRVYIWNQGNRPIISAAHDILRPIRLMLPTDVEILDERVLQVSRAETGFKITVNQTDKNILDIEFSILESGDGAAIQIIYAGSPSAKLAMDGSIVGQSNPHEEPLYSNEKDVPLYRQIKNMTNFDLAAIAFIVVGMTTFIFLPVIIQKLGINPNFQRIAVPVMALVILLGIGVTLLLTTGTKYTPYRDIPKSIVNSGTG